MIVDELVVEEERQRNDKLIILQETLFLRNNRGQAPFILTLIGYMLSRFPGMETLYCVVKTVKKEMKKNSLKIGGLSKRMKEKEK